MIRDIGISVNYPSHRVNRSGEQYFRPKMAIFFPTFSYNKVKQHAHSDPDQHSNQSQTYIMLASITIKNFGLIDEVHIEFGEGLNILTGETGAGKSILIEALRVGLGGRITSAHVRDPKKKCIIQGVVDLSSSDLMDVPEIQDFLNDDDPQLIIQRIFGQDGRSKIQINGLNVTATQLKAIGRHLIDFHGAHDHQMLLSSDSHQTMLDRLIDFGPTMTKYIDEYQKFSRVAKQLRDLQNLSQNRERELDMLTHQVQELEQVSLESQSYEKLLSDREKINNIERLSAHLNTLVSTFEDGDHGITKSIQKLFAPMRSLNGIDRQTEALMDQLNQLQTNSESLIAELNDYAASLAFDPQQADEIHRKFDLYDDILRKYGPTIEDAKTYYAEASEKLERLTHLESDDQQLKKTLEQTEKSLRKIGGQMSTKRKRTATQLKKTIEQELSELGIANVQFECRVTPGEIDETGTDNIEFYISPNAGFDLKPLAEIVSSGEAARVMLALKKALIKVDPIPTLIFDEIDAQIGGRLGTITGQKLRDISRERQVILITHLPQIASFADRHFKVVKSVRLKKTVTEVIRLSKEDRVEEIAQMMSGKDQSDISLKHARDLLSNAAKA